MRIPIYIASAALASIVVFAAAGADDPAGKRPPTSKPAPKASTAKSGAKSSATPAKSTGKTTPTGTSKSTAQGSRTPGSKPATTKQTASKQAASRYRRSIQQQPTPERYREIQQALADKGYFGGTVDGNWGPESVDALKRFQHEQNLPDDGKIGSLSLIALGLGPRHEAAALPPAEKSTP